MKRDVESFVAARRRARAASSAPAASRPVPSVQVTPGVSQTIPLSSMRKTIARRLSESMFCSPHFYVTVDVDMDRAVDLRAQLKEAGEKISVNDFVVRACALALRAVPQVNASWAPAADGSPEAIVLNGDVHVGIAVAIPDGLITPVVQFADQKPIAAIAAEIRELADRAKSKKLKPEEYTGRHVHHLEPRHDGRARVHRDHQPAGLGHPVGGHASAKRQWWARTIRSRSAIA